MNSFSFPINFDSFDAYPVYLGDDLEVNYQPEHTCFKIWSPDIEEAQLRLYKNDTDKMPEIVHLMTAQADGVWSVLIPGDLKGRFYTFQVKTEGTWLPETPGAYAKAVGVNGNKAAVVDLRDSDPEGWENDCRPAMAHRSEAIVYELHIRDFSMSPDSGIQHRGKYLAFTETGTKNADGLSTGIDHLKEMGFTHLHLQPTFDFASIDESRLQDNKYNWGYDPLNFWVPEGSYSTNPSDPLCRIREFKQLIQSLHQAGIRIVMDMVFNHTFTWEKSHLNFTTPGYYYRHYADGSYANASGCGNETASERPMVRKYIVDCMVYWAKEYHVDGFRIDLMGVHDVETMNTLRTALDEIDPTLLIYGEGWSAGDSPLPYEQRAVKQHANQMPGIGVFSDDLRDALRGTWANAREPGFACGHHGYDETIKFGVVGGTQHDNIHYGLLNYSNAPYALDPYQSISYVSCHDDMCLRDKLSYSAPSDVNARELIKFDRLAQAVVLTSQGTPFLFAGEELFRTKQGVHNTYQSPDSVNQLAWEQKKTYLSLCNYYKGLIQLRRAHPAFRMPTTTMVQEKLHFLFPNQACVVAFTLDNHANEDPWERILVVYNGNRYPISLSIPAENWWVCCNGESIAANGLFKWSQTELSVPASSAMILFKP